MVWMLFTKDESEAIIELNTMSDRAAAIVGGSILETRLETLLKSILMDHSKGSGHSIHGENFRFSGSLGSLKAKIDISFMLGLFSKNAWRDLDYIREIRNAFAHKIEAQNFNTQQIKDWCGQLCAFEKHLFKRGLTDEETPKISPKMFEENLDEQLADPRKRYLLCIRFYVAAIGFKPAADPKVPLQMSLC